MQLAPDIQVLLFLPETLPCSQPASSFDLPLFLFPSGFRWSAVLVKLGYKRINCTKPTAYVCFPFTRFLLTFSLFC